MDKDLISIHILARNSEKTLPFTLEGILKQENVTFEIIFINDGSTDRTLKIIEDFKLKNSQIACTIITNAINLGITKSRNIALKNSKGEYIAVCDSDDIWIDNLKLSKQLSEIKKDANYIAIGTQMNIINSDKKILKQTNYKIEDREIRKEFLFKNQIGHSTVLFKKNEQFYDESLYIWEDYDFFLKLGLLGKIKNINEVTTNYLYNPKKYTAQEKNKLNKTELEIIRKYKKEYPNFYIGFLKFLIKKILLSLHLK